MGVDTGYDGPYGGTRLYPMSGGSSRAPIDLTDSPPKKRRGKRKSADIDDFANEPPKKRKTKRKSTDDAEDGAFTSEVPKKRKMKGKSTDDADDGGRPVKKKAKSKNEEKRLKRWRDKAPQSYGEIRGRALTQRMFVVDRQRHDATGEGELAHPTEVVKLAGTTGNIYTITIDRLPSCDCPHARKGNQCKHIVYVLARVLRAPAHLEYQLAFVSSELRDIFEKAPPLPFETADDSAKDGNRKELTDCPICCEDFEPENSSEKVVYCKAACGNNIHEECFKQWAATKAGGNVTCPFCRTPWDFGGDDQAIKMVAQSGSLNAEGYVNVASQLGLSGRRDYSSYHEYWVRRRMRNGEDVGDYDDGW
ncbi:hypothetical protein CLAFUW4_14804 [Fulvia fulva]|nr:hypothetical protein CLAFUR4_14796 [Fulvia fulva]KAK4609539.1 hypothetical protein CLAFUR0_14796 [Fulvia fulva]WPV22557.1 hypothetical protein CLAFUW4_14804 [Fulvia fulva]WPV37462.1 hypothetical protein CLAFUW7_14805 [Fulvia fulva]